MLHKSLIVLLVLSFFLTQALSAAPEAAVIKLPEPKGAAPLKIDRSNAADYFDLIPAELYPLVIDGSLDFPVYATIPAQSGFQDLSAAAAAGGETTQIDAHGGLSPDLPIANPLPLGSVATIEGELDEAQRARKILWSSSLVWAPLRSMQIDLRFKELGLDAQGGPDEIGAKLSRVYPRSIQGTTAPAQIFREKLALLTPQFLVGSSWLSFRQFAAEEDLVWFSSAAIKKTRQLTGTNRSDRLLTLSASLEDLLTFSGNVANIEPHGVQSIKSFVPVLVDASARSTKLARGCAAISSRGSSDLVGGAQGKLLLSGSASEIALPAVFVPRDLWRVEFSTNDPYSEYGRQLLYIDKQSMLPLLKIVYDRRGEVYKRVLSVFGGAAGERGRVPFPVLTVVMLGSSSRATVIRYQNTTYCEGYPVGAELGDFDPSVLSPAAVAN